MGMSAWGLLAAPLMAHGPAPVTTIQEPAVMTVISADTDYFDGLAIMDSATMSDASGGAATAIEVGEIALINIANNKGQVTDVNAAGSTTGQIANNAVNGNGGITTVFNNTGNGVIFQSNVNVNIYTDNSGAPN